LPVKSEHLEEPKQINNGNREKVKWFTPTRSLLHTDFLNESCVPFEVSNNIGI